MSQIYQPWRRTEAQWIADDPVIPLGVMALTYDPGGDNHGLFKMGTGAVWSLTNYIGGADYTPGIVSVDTEVLPGTASSVVITLPAGYKGFRIEAKLRSARTASSDPIFLRFNGDTGNNYQYEVFNAASTVVTAAEAATPTSRIDNVGYAPGTTAPADYYGHIVIDIPFPDSIVGWKDSHSRCGFALGTAAGDINYRHTWGIWRNTAALLTATLASANSQNLSGTIKLLGFK